MGQGSVPQSCESASHGCPSRRLRVEASVSWRFLFCMFLSTGPRRSSWLGVLKGRFIKRQCRQRAGGIGGQRLTVAACSGHASNVRTSSSTSWFSFAFSFKRGRVWRPVDKTPSWSFTSLRKRARVWRPVDKAPLEFHVSQKTCEGLASCRQNAAGVSRLSENV